MGRHEVMDGTWVRRDGESKSVFETDAEIANLAQILGTGSESRISRMSGPKSPHLP